jgi:GNAT superfamily N-acetyltransferase
MEVSLMLHPVVDSACYAYWSNGLDIPVSKLKSGECLFVTSGRYIERVPGRVYVVFDYLHHTCVFAGPGHLVEAFQSRYTPEEIAAFDADTILQCGFFEQRKPCFNDLDHYLPVPKQLTPVSSACELIELSKDSDLSVFYADCSEDDVDTLDLDMDTDVALAGVIDGEVVGVASYRVPAESQIGDITVLVRRAFRGQGLAVPLVSALIERMESAGFVPHYRAAVHNAKSLSVARRLGFQLAQQILVWDGFPDEKSI